MAKNNKWTGKPIYQKYGDWDKVKRLVANFSAEAKRINDESLMQFGLKAEREAVLRMQQQPPEWPALNPEYKARKKAKGLSEKTLIATSTYFQSITTKVDGRVVMAGVFRKSLYPDGRVVADIAKIHEYGSAKNNIPARPLWGPVFKSVKSWALKEKFFAKRLHDELLKKYR